MSIRAEIVRRVGEGRLLPLVPVMGGTVVQARQIFLTPVAVAALDGPWVTPAVERLCGQARARLEEFVQGDLIVGRMPPSKSVDTVIAQLTPASDNVWEFRVGSPKPGIRIFGRFAEQDCFIATNWGARRDFIDPATGTDDLRRWRDEIIRCKTEWTNLFPVYDPLSGSILSDYISNSRLPV
jgi:hypothetical protein